MYRATMISPIYDYNSCIHSAHYSRSPRTKPQKELLLEQVYKKAKRNHLVFAGTWILCIVVNLAVLVIKIL